MAELSVSQGFWATVEAHRDTSHYRPLRARLLQFVQAKEAARGSEPAVPGDRPFTNPVLRGVWHVHLIKKPEIVLFYGVQGGRVVLAMLGDHSDYAYRGARSQADGRLANRVAGAMEGAMRPSPDWGAVRWRDPLALLNHPDLPEMSLPALLRLSDEISQEQETGERFERLYGFSPLDARDEDFEAYMADLSRASGFVQALARGALRHRHWMLQPDPAGFELAERTPRRA